MEDPPSCHTGICSPGVDWKGEAIVLQLLSGPGPYTSSLSSIDMLGLPFYNSYWMLRVHGRAIMNYQLNHGRFTDDWSICVVRTSTEEGKKNLIYQACMEIFGQLEAFQKIRQGFIIWIEWTLLRIERHADTNKSSHFSVAPSHLLIQFFLHFCHNLWCTRRFAFPRRGHISARHSITIYCFNNNWGPGKF